ncbi:MAG: hypothetical protein IJD36_00330 [Clostridia bacterium]|nr:hypothetical protein [Clostridia bacterium]
MELQQNTSYTSESLETLKCEVAQLENITLVAIEDLEKRLENFVDIVDIKDENWSPRLDTIEIYTLDKAPELSDSIRKIELSELI